jgi:hypothetical protein
MNERGGFPWLLAAAGAGLMLVAMLTVSIRSTVVSEGAMLQQSVQQRASLERRVRALELRYQAMCRELGAQVRRVSRDGWVGP